MLEQEDVIQAKDTEIAQLREELSAAKASPRPMSASSPFATPKRMNLTRSIVDGEQSATALSTSYVRRGKAPPIEPLPEKAQVFIGMTGC